MVELSRPPLVPQLGEHPPVVEPMLRELPPFQGIAVSAARRVEVTVSDGREFAELSERARETALADDRVRAALGGHRHTVIGLSQLDTKRSSEAQYVLVAYSYDDNMAYEISVAEHGGRLSIGEVRASAYQPAPSDEEVEAAIRIASGHNLVAGRLKSDYDAHVLLVSAVEPGDEHYGRRRFSVVFGPADERLPRVHAVVDVGSERLVWVASQEGVPS